MANTKRKLLLISRHGEKSGKDLVPATVPRLYDGMGGDLRAFVQAYHITPEQVSLRHSPEVRTRYTGESALAGAFSILPKPQKQEDLANLVKGLYDEGLDVMEVPELGYGGLTFNMDAVKADEVKFMNNWMGNPDADSYEGKPNTPFNYVLKSRGEYLRGFLSGFVQCTRDLAHLSTHGGIVDSFMMSLANPARATPATPADIGGMFNQEQYATLTLDQKGKSGTYKATLQRDGTSYPVNIRKLLNV